MSITTTKYFRVGGTLADATSFTAGVVRNDTGAVVIAAGTALTHVSTGIYRLTITEPASGLTYTASFSAVYGGTANAWTEQLSGDSEEEILMPAITGDTLVDTLNSLLVERLRVARGGPKPSYSIAGQRVDWNQYMKYLDQRVEAIRREIAQSVPLEEIGIGY